MYSEPNTDLDGRLDTDALIDTVDEPDARPIHDTIVNVAAYTLGQLKD